MRKEKCPDYKMVIEQQLRPALVDFISDLENISDTKDTQLLIRRAQDLKRQIGYHFCYFTTNMDRLSFFHFIAKITKQKQERVEKKYGARLYADRYRFIVDTDLDIRGEGKIRQLPDNLEVVGSFNINFSGVKELPKGLVVYGDLILDENNFITELPDDIVVKGKLMLNASNEKLGQQALALSEKGQVSEVMFNYPAGR
ncbi:hypothetical protein HON36_05490 [Candidatus Parcubacteria bacterium]|jgi:hypothetical protein|nr:hypothetical protein [Candidatus Parcubacteria bacterium]MBT7228689.1 hypothetical protein [Candidatus Parcubacteria bacterium]